MNVLFKIFLDNQRLQPLRGLGNTPIELLNFIPYALNRNYLMLVYDPQAKKIEDAYSIHYFPCYADFFKLEGVVVYPYEDSTTLLYNNGHTFLFHNKNSEIKLDIINRLKQNPQLWVQDKRVKITGKLNKPKKSKKYNKKTKTKKTKKSRKHKITKKRKQNKKRKMTKKR